MTTVSSHGINGEEWGREINPVGSVSGGVADGLARAAGSAGLEAARPGREAASTAGGERFQ
jgi:hypothetical protein